MEWNRWPVDHTDPHHLGALQAEVLTEERGRREEGGGRGGARHRHAHAQELRGARAPGEGHQWHGLIAELGGDEKRLVEE